MGVPESDPVAQLSLPPGFRFYPTDEELLVQYLCRKVAGHHFSLQIIAEIDLYKFDPWVLPSKAIFGEKEWYFFSPRDRKYPNGSRPNRVAGSGYWKATGTDKVISTEGRKVGIKKALVFYVGKAPKGTKTNWIMHEYRLLDSSRNNGSTKLDDWVLCRIYKKNSCSHNKTLLHPMAATATKENSNGSSSSSSSHIDEVLASLPEINVDTCFALPRLTWQHQQQQNTKMNIQNLGGANGNFADWAKPAVLNSVAEFTSSGNNRTQSQGGMMNYKYNNDIHVLPLCHVESMVREEEVQSGVSNSGLYQQSPNVFSYPGQTIGFRFKQ